MGSENKNNEVLYNNYNMEFAKFFNEHRLLCEQISGIKPISENTYINKDNLEFAFKKIYAFFSNNEHYIDNFDIITNIENEYNTLEDDFQNDKNYIYLKKNNTLSIAQEIKYNQLYVDYLFRCFNIIYKINKNLQKSMQITTGQISKIIRYFNSDIFYQNLSDYRKEISDELSIITFVNILFSFKKIVSYYYTYKYLINISVQDQIDSIINNLYNEIIDKENINDIIKKRENVVTNPTFQDKIKTKERNFRKLLKEIYVLVNTSLQDKDILPKHIQKLEYDTSII